MKTRATCATAFCNRADAIGRHRSRVMRWTTRRQTQAPAPAAPQIAPKTLAANRRELPTSPTGNQLKCQRNWDNENATSAAERPLAPDTTRPSDVATNSFQATVARSITEFLKTLRRSRGRTAHTRLAFFRANALHQAKPCSRRPPDRGLPDR